MTNEEMLLRAIESGKLIDEKVYDETVKVIFEEIKKRAVAEHTHNADAITDGTNKSIPTKAKQEEWNKKVTTEQLNAAVNAFASGLAWKGVHTNLAELNKAIPTPKEGYFVIVTQEPTYNNKNTMLIYEAEEVNKWQTIGEIFVPGKATQQADGLMSKEDKKKLDDLHNYTLPVANVNTLGGVKAKQGGTITIDSNGVVDINAEKVISNEERAKWNKAATDVVTAQNTANTANETANNALNKANANEGKINTANGKITELEGKFVYLTTQEAQAIINKYKA